MQYEGTRLRVPISQESWKGIAMCFGQIVSAIGAQAQGKFEQKVAQRNAKIHKIQATQALARGEMDAATVGREFAQLVGRQKAVFASQGFDVSVGDPERITEATLAIGRQEQALVQYNAQLDAWAATEAAVGAITAGEAARFRANISTVSSSVSAAQGLVTTGREFGKGGGFSGFKKDIGKIF